MITISLLDALYNSFYLIYAERFHASQQINYVPVAAKELASSFKHAREAKVAELLTALAAIGQAREIKPGTYVS